MGVVSDVVKVIAVLIVAGVISFNIVDLVL